MSQLVAWEPTDYEHLFNNREQMQDTLGVQRKTLGQWIAKKLIGIKQKTFLDNLLTNEKDKKIANSKTPIQYRPVKKAHSKAKLKALDREEEQKEDQIRKIKKLVVNGSTLKSLASRLFLSENAVKNILHTKYKTYAFDVAKEIIMSENSLTTNK